MDSCAIIENIQEAVAFGGGAMVSEAAFKAEYLSTFPEMASVVEQLESSGHSSSLSGGLVCGMIAKIITLAFVSCVVIYYSNSSLFGSALNYFMGVVSYVYNTVPSSLSSYFSTFSFTKVSEIPRTTVDNLSSTGKYLVKMLTDVIGNIKTTYENPLSLMSLSVVGAASTVFNVIQYMTFIDVGSKAFDTVLAIICGILKGTIYTVSYVTKAVVKLIKMLFQTKKARKAAKVNVSASPKSPLVTRSRSPMLSLRIASSPPPLQPASRSMMLRSPRSPKNLNAVLDTAIVSDLKKRARTPKMNQKDKLTPGEIRALRVLEARSSSSL